MKKAVAAAAVVFGLIFSSSVFAAEPKFAFIDFAKVFGEYSKTKEYDKAFKEKQNTYESGREKLVSEIKQFQDKLNLLSDKEKEGKKGELEAKIRNLQEFDRQNQTDLRKEQEEKLKELVKDIEDAVKQYAEKEKITFVFHDKALAYADTSLDITTQVSEIVNKARPAVKK